MFQCNYICDYCAISSPREKRDMGRWENRKMCMARKAIFYVKSQRVYGMHDLLGEIL